MVVRKSHKLVKSKSVKLRNGNKNKNKKNINKRLRTKKNRKKQTKLRKKKYQKGGREFGSIRSALTGKYGAKAKLKNAQGKERTDIMGLSHIRGTMDSQRELSALERQMQDNYESNKAEIRDYTDWINKQVMESLSTRISNDLLSMGLLNMGKYFKIASNNLYARKSKHFFNFNFGSTSNFGDNYKILIAQMSVILNLFYKSNKESLKLGSLEKKKTNEYTSDDYVTKSVIYFVAHSDIGEDVEDFLNVESKKGVKNVSIYDKDSEINKQISKKFVDFNDVLLKNNLINTEPELENMFENFLNLDNQHYHNVSEKYKHHTKYLYDKNSENPKLITRTLITETSSTKDSKSVEVTREHVIKGIRDFSYTDGSDCFAKTLTDLDDYQIEKTRLTLNLVYDKAKILREDREKLKKKLDIKTIKDLKDNLDKVDSVLKPVSPKGKVIKNSRQNTKSERIKKVLNYYDNFNPNLGELKMENVNNCLLPYCRSKILDLLLIKIREFNNQIYKKLSDLDDMKIKCDGKESSFTQDIDESTLDLLKKYVKLYEFLDELKISTNKYKQISKIALGFLPYLLLRLLQEDKIVFVFFVNRAFLKALYYYFKDSDDTRVTIKSINHGSYIKIEKIRHKINKGLGHELNQFISITNDDFAKIFYNQNRQIAATNKQIITRDKLRVSLYENQFNFLTDDTTNIMTDSNKYFYNWKISETPVEMPIYLLKKQIRGEIDEELSDDTTYDLRFSAEITSNYLLQNKPKYSRDAKSNYMIMLEEIYVEFKLNDYGINFYLTSQGIMPYNQSINLLEEINKLIKNLESETSNRNEFNQNEFNDDDISLQSLSDSKEIIFLICHKFESLPGAKKLLKRSDYFDFFTSILNINIPDRDARAIRLLASSIQSQSQRTDYLPKFDNDITEIRERLKFFLKEYDYEIGKNKINEELGEYKVYINLRVDLYKYGKVMTRKRKDKLLTLKSYKENSELDDTSDDVKDINSLYLTFMGFKLDK